MGACRYLGQSLQVIISKMRRDKKFHQPDQEPHESELRKEAVTNFRWLGAKETIIKYVSSLNPMTWRTLGFTWLCGGFRPMSGKNRRLVADEPVEVQAFRKFTHYVLGNGFIGTGYRWLTVPIKKLLDVTGWPLCWSAHVTNMWPEQWVTWYITG